MKDLKTLEVKALNDYKMMEVEGGKTLYSVLHWLKQHTGTKFGNIAQNI